MKRIVLLAAACLAGALAQAETRIIMDGSTTVGPIAKAFAEYYMKAHPDVNISVSESGSGNGAKSIINKACDIANMSRPMKEEEKQAATDNGVSIKEHVIAMDGLAVVVNPANSVAELTRAQLKKIFMGEITNWKELGGPDKEIVVISRDTNSGTFETFQTLVMKNDRVVDSAETVGSNGAVRQRVQTTMGAIGYVGLAFMEGVKSLAIDGVEASVDAVNEGKYPIRRPLFMYTNGEPKAGTPLADVVGLCLTAPGKQILSEQGFVPVK